MIGHFRSSKHYRGHPCRGAGVLQNWLEIGERVPWKNGCMTVIIDIIIDIKHCIITSLHDFVNDYSQLLVWNQGPGVNA